jgi:hypothetical protein
MHHATKGIYQYNRDATCNASKSFSTLFRIYASMHDDALCPPFDATPIRPTLNIKMTFDKIIIDS